MCGDYNHLVYVFSFSFFEKLMYKPTLGGSKVFSLFWLDIAVT